MMSTKEKREYHRKKYFRWKSERPDRLKEIQQNAVRSYRARNPSRTQINYNNDRAKRKGAFGVITVREWEDLKKMYGYTCPSCGRCEPEIKLTPDHIIPFSKGGFNVIENIQPLCITCNKKKFTNVIFYKPI